MRRRIGLLAKHISEATGACLLAMVQGNLLMLGLSHWIIAAQTGVLAGIVTTVAVVLGKVRRHWIIAGVLAGATAFVDFFVHNGPVQERLLEAAITGVVAGLLSLLAGWLLSWPLKKQGPKRISA